MQMREDSSESRITADKRQLTRRPKLEQHDNDKQQLFLKSDDPEYR